MHRIKHCSGHSKSKSDCHRYGFSDLCLPRTGFDIKRFGCINLCLELWIYNCEPNSYNNIYSNRDISNGLYRNCYGKCDREFKCHHHSKRFSCSHL